jgi:hypothetical protein
MTGRASETYLKPADSAASLGSTIACALSAKSTNTDKSLHLPPQTNLLQTWFHKEGDAHAARQWSGFFLSFKCRTRATSGACPFFLDQSIASCCVLKVAITWSA